MENQTENDEVSTQEKEEGIRKVTEAVKRGEAVLIVTGDLDAIFLWVATRSVSDIVKGEWHSQTDGGPWGSAPNPTQEAIDWINERAESRSWWQVETGEEAIDAAWGGVIKHDYTVKATCKAEGEAGCVQSGAQVKIDCCVGIDTKGDEIEDGAQYEVFNDELIFKLSK